jgi:protein-disulfide isomerase
LDFHPNALPAAKAAYCAGQSDPRLFWKLHDWIFANQEKWASAQDAPEQFRTQALALGLDAAKYDACVSSTETAAAISRDIQEGVGMGVNGTPAFFVNDWFISGAYPFEEFQKTIEKAQQGIHPPPTPTPLPEGVAPYDADPARPGLTYDGSPTQGDPKARLVLVAFEDFKCSYCLQHFKEVEPTLRSKYIDTGQMREVFKFLPIYAPKAAVASLCAAQQGKFWEFHDVLFNKQAEWQDGDDAAMIAYAEGLGLDKSKFTQCLSDASVQAQVDADAELSQQLGLSGTPSFILIDTQAGTGTRIPGVLTAEQFEQAIQSLLNPPTPTPAAQ